jgi:hypothetical protein
MVIFPVLAVEPASRSASKRSLPYEQEPAAKAGNFATRLPSRVRIKAALRRLSANARNGGTQFSIPRIGKSTSLTKTQDDSDKYQTTAATKGHRLATNKALAALSSIAAMFPTENR